MSEWESDMAGSVNKVILVGNLGRDPEARQMQDGNPVVNLSLATSESWRDKNTGERREKTEWHRVVIFNDKLADVAQKYLRKGSKIYIEGQLQTRKWTDQSGVEKYSTEVVLQRFRGELQMLDRAGEGAVAVAVAVAEIMTKTGLRAVDREARIAAPPPAAASTTTFLSSATSPSLSAPAQRRLRRCLQPNNRL